MGKISFFYEEINFILPYIRKTKAWIKTIINQEKFESEQINFIFCSDSYLHGLNVEYLNHDTYTDIVTFDYSEGRCLEGDIYISIDRVKENAQNLNIDFFEELKRVMAHGVLHMMGYGDKTQKEQKLMRLKEDSCLSLYNEN